MPHIAPYGSWKSPITAQLVTSKAVSIGQIAREGSAIYWLEFRPEEGGRGVIVRPTDEGALLEVNPPPFNARTTVHEYGGGDFCVANGVVYFSNFADQRLYACRPGEDPRPLTPEGPFRYADAVFDAWRNRLVCVREDHTVDKPAEAINTLAAINVENGQMDILASGSDFYSSPRLSPDGTRLAWLEWDHPNMPWESGRLMLADVQPDGSLSTPQVIAGGSGVSVFQPHWSPEGVLHFVADPEGWWNLYRFCDGQIEALYPMEAEFGLPQWVFGLSTYDFLPNGDIICAYARNGLWRLARLNPETHTLVDIDLPYTLIRDVLRVGDQVVMKAGSPTQPMALVRFDPSSGAVEILRSSLEVTVDARYFSIPETIEFPTEDGLTAFGYFYPPTNPDYVASEGERPPLLVVLHGGPTSAAAPVLSYSLQYWTSRGFAVFDVNYGGSTGFGRAYRERLKGQWGVVDVADCVNGARYLADQGRVDAQRMAIRGGSAGGYTTLAALAVHDVFRAGASYYGVSDLEALALETHKFESRYLDSLIGPYPEAKAIYQARSPIYHVDRIQAALILFQGLEDKVVPPDQSERIYYSLRQRGVPVAYLPFAGEGHGFRRADTIQRSLEAELYFYGKVFGFEPADPIEPVTIDHLSMSYSDNNILQKRNRRKDVHRPRHPS